MPTCCVYVDGANLFHSAETLGVRIDYKKLKEILEKDKTVITLNYYDTCEGNRAEEAFFSNLRSFGYNTKLVRLHKYGPQKPEEKMIDTQIVADSLVDGFRQSPNIIFCSGDKDILPAIEYLIQMNIQVEIVAFRHSMAWKLITSGAKIFDLTKIIYRIKR